ncbi:MAG: PqqD family peptide modification chaperone [Brevibacterium aurantiacum]
MQVRLTGAYWHLNESASGVLGVLQQGGTSDDAISGLVETYGIAEPRATDDVSCSSDPCPGTGRSTASVSASPRMWG